MTQPCNFNFRGTRTNCNEFRSDDLWPDLSLFDAPLTYFTFSDQVKSGLIKYGLRLKCQLNAGHLIFFQVKRQIFYVRFSVDLTCSENFNINGIYSIAICSELEESCTNDVKRWEGSGCERYKSRSKVTLSAWRRAGQELNKIARRNLCTAH